jgi:transcriptional regulator with XRE-family HTH domain
LKGYTQRELAEKIHVSVSVLGEIERGNRLPTRKILMDIARVLDIELEEIVTYKKN